MIYIESDSHDPYWNLALEQYVFDGLGQDKDCCMLWQNDNTIVIGKYQNTFAEINHTYVAEHHIHVARRLSGGGAVYHDLGNINFTFITQAEHLGGLDFAAFCRPVVKVLDSLSVKAEINGRNDITIDGKKFSGNSQYVKHGRVMHHGTILFDSDLETVQMALRVSKDKLESKGVQSVSSRVTNIRPYLKQDMPTDTFFGLLRDFLVQEYQMEQITLTDKDREDVQSLRDSAYARWAWNYGASPAFSIVKERRVEGCGKLEIHMNTDKGMISDIQFYGDYFSIEDSQALVQLLVGQRLEQKSICHALKNVDLARYFAGMNLHTFSDILFA